MKTFKEFKTLLEEVKTVAPLWQRKGKVFPLNPGKWKSEWKNKYNVQFIKIEKLSRFGGKEIHTYVHVKGEEEDLANWFKDAFLIKKHGSKAIKYPEALELAKDADDKGRISYPSQY